MIRFTSRIASSPTARAPAFPRSCSATVSKRNVSGLIRGPLPARPARRVVQQLEPDQRGVELLQADRHRHDLHRLQRALQLRQRGVVARVHHRDRQHVSRQLHREQPERADQLAGNHGEHGGGEIEVAQLGEGDDARPCPPRARVRRNRRRGAARNRPPVAAAPRCRSRAPGDAACFSTAAKAIIRSAETPRDRFAHRGHVPEHPLEDRGREPEDARGFAGDDEGRTGPSRSAPASPK